MITLFRPTPALNVYAAGGIVFVALGSIGLGIGLFLPASPGWVRIQSLGLLFFGLLWVTLAARIGRLDDPPRVGDGAESAVVRIIDARWPGPLKRSHGAVTHRLCCLDLEVDRPGIPIYRVRSYRNLPVAIHDQAVRGNTLNARADPTRPREIHLLWLQPINR